MTLMENSDSEDEVVISVRKTKNRAIADSDSEDNSEQVTNYAHQNVDNESTEAENEDDFEKEISQEHSCKKTKRIILKSDSEEEDSESVVRDSFSRVYNGINCDNDGGNKRDYEDPSSDGIKPVYKPKYSSDIYDAEGSEEESDITELQAQERSDGGTVSESVNQKSNSKERKKIKTKKERIACNNMREIRRESQRMVRESSCILPYHRPKQRTLAEFIQRRKAGPSIPIKTNKEHLMRLGKQIEEMEKKTEEFFKSDDSNDDSDEEYIPTNIKMNDENKINLKLKTDDIDTYKQNLDDDCNSKDSFISSSNVKILDSSTNVNDIMTNEKFDRMINENNGESNKFISESSKLSAKIETQSTDEFASDKSNMKIDKENAELLKDKSAENNCSTTYLFTEVNEKSPDKLNKANSYEFSQSSANINEDKCNENDCVTKSVQNSEEFTFELRMTKDSEQVIEPEVNVNNSKTLISFEEKSNNLTEGSVEVSVSHSEIIYNDTVKRSMENITTSSSKTLVEFQDSEDFILRMEDSEKIESFEPIKNIHCENNLIDINNEFCVEADKNKKRFDWEGYVEEENIKCVEKSKESDKSEDKLEDDNKYKKGLGKNCTLKNRFREFDIDFKKNPQLKGHSSEKIHLFSPPKSSAILDLKKRFFEHFTMDKNITIKENIEISVISAEKNCKGDISDIKHETINNSTKIEEKWLEDIKKAQQPGEKLSRLKAHLEKQLRERWKEEWEKRIQEYKLNEEQVEDSKSDYENEAILDDENDETDLTETESEEDVEENDIPLIDKKRPQNDFLDDEADVSDDENEGVEGNAGDEGPEEIEENEDLLLGNNGSDVEDDKDDSDIDNDGEDADEEEEESENSILSHKTNKKIKLKFEDDSDETDLDDMSSVLCSVPENKNLPVSRSDSQVSGELFPSSQFEINSRKFTRIEDLVKDDNTNKLSQSDIMGICSGAFPSQPIALSQLEGSDEKVSQFFTQSQNCNLSSSLSTEESKELKDVTHLRKQRSLLEDSDDEVFEKSQKNKKHKIHYSDDEEEGDIESNSNKVCEDDVTDAEENKEDEDDEFIDMNEEAEVEYDSEENEIIKDGKSFLENEAELSESEWGSEDEDEKDLDNFEAEAGDEEILDQDKLNTELGKIHMQQLLVEDKKEIRLLQELLLEDGELHTDGSGRVRQFRWANADNDNADGKLEMLRDSDDDSDHDEEDENWRRIRHEREVYLKKQAEKLKELGIEDALEEKKENGDDLFEIGHAALKKMQKNVPVLKPVQQNARPKLGFGLNSNISLNMAAAKRGSFLKNSDHFLSRLAHITSKVGSESNMNGPKNSRNFVFSVVSPPKKQENAEAEGKKTKKRKADVNVENLRKKIRFEKDIKNNASHKSLLEMLAVSN
ncbi:uncharacterized protein LOC142325090 [Lycorma delicatula]|uniref:uncharacterized protein LOC142325090 n=1 Tax=Lycorma delicatula TaxID=130591 RepID=UPI003F50FC5A